MLVVVGTQGRLDQFQVEPKHPVLTEVLHIFEAGIEFDFQFLLGRLALPGALVTLRVETYFEKFQQQAGQFNVVHQRVGDKGLTVGKAYLAHIPGVGPQQRDFPPAHVGREQHPVEGVVFRFSVPHPAEQLLKDRTDTMNIDNSPLVSLEREVVNPHRFVVPVDDLEGVFADNPEAEVVEDRHHIGKRQRFVRVEKLEMQRALVFFQSPVEAHGKVMIVRR